MEDIPFFYRIVTSEFLAEILKIPEGCHKEWLIQFGLDLSSGNGTTSYAKKVIAEVQEYRRKQAENGRNRWKDINNRKERVAKRVTRVATGSHKGRLGNSSNNNNNKNLITYSEEFEAFWKEYPRAKKKPETWMAWQKQNPIITVVLDALKWQIESSDWKDHDGKYIPYSASYINQRRWEDKPQCQKTATPQEIYNQKVQAAL